MVTSTALSCGKELNEALNENYTLVNTKHRSTQNTKMHSSSELTIQDAGSQTGGHDWPSCQLLVKATKSAMDIEISQGVSKMLPATSSLSYTGRVVIMCSLAGFLL